MGFGFLRFLWGFMGGFKDFKEIVWVFLGVLGIL